MRVSDFHFDLPEELIAQHPPAERGSSRMLVVERASAVGEARQFRDELFQNLPRILRPGDLLILNDSRVLPARLYATREGLKTQVNSPQPTGQIEILLTEQIEDLTEAGENLWRALVKPARKVQPGETLLFHGPMDEDGAASEPVLTAEVLVRGESGERTLRFGRVDDFYERIARIGHMPLPPYIHREQAAQADSEEDRERYQTVYSQEPGSAAAPTAGLHFTPEMLSALVDRGVEIAYVTLHVGLGTFQPVRVERVEDIRLHAERYTLPAATADAVNRAMREGRRIVAVGTTTTRTLEHVWLRLHPGLSSETWGSQTVGGGGRIEAHSGSTSIFIGPGHRFRIVSGMLTNFHLPESTLLMLVAAFAAPQGEAAADQGDEGRKTILAAYAHAIRERYRFYSYGDCMLLL